VPAFVFALTTLRVDGSDVVLVIGAIPIKGYFEKVVAKGAFLQLS